MAGEMVARRCPRIILQVTTDGEGVDRDWRPVALNDNGIAISECAVDRCIDDSRQPGRKPLPSVTVWSRDAVRPGFVIGAQLTGSDGLGSTRGE